MLGALAILVLGLFQTQVIKGRDYRARSENNRMRLIRLEAPRGDIFDRSGILLATNRPAYHVYLIPEDFDPEELPMLSKLLSLSGEEIRLRTAVSRYASFTPVLVKQDVSKEVAMQIEEQRPKLGGVLIQVQFIRTYPLGKIGAHTIGYVGKISKEEYAERDRSVYHFDSWIGRVGIEREYDLVLRGEDGGRQLEVNAKGVPIRLLSEQKPKGGSNVRLTLDTKLEALLRPLLGDRRGAILVMDLKTGNLLADISTPVFDPNAFVSPSRQAERLSLIRAKERPLFDRGFNGLYPPGSVFKLVTAMAGLETGVITPHTTFQCPGYFRLNPNSRKFKCWFEEGHGRIDLYTAIERSCNVYFYQVGRLVGSKRLAAYARKIGFGSSSEIDLPTASGLVPDEDWKNERYQDPWYAGETISFAIGQSYLLVSPLQILRLISTVATDGRVSGPKLVLEPASNHFIPKNKKILELGKNALVRDIHPTTFRVLRQAMLQAVASDKGTAQFARVDFGKLAAKTGTAQAPPGDAHAWFGGFYPYEDPQIGVVVFVERGRSGGITAARIAKEVVEQWSLSHGPASV